MMAYLCKSHALLKFPSSMPVVSLSYTQLNNFLLGHSSMAGPNNVAHQTNTSSLKSSMGFGAYPTRSNDTHSSTDGWQQTSTYITRGHTLPKKITKCPRAITIG